MPAFTLNGTEYRVVAGNSYFVDVFHLWRAHSRKLRTVMTGDLARAEVWPFTTDLTTTRAEGEALVAALKSVGVFLAGGGLVIPSGSVPVVPRAVTWSHGPGSDRMRVNFELFQVGGVIP